MELRPALSIAYHPSGVPVPPTATRRPTLTPTPVSRRSRVARGDGTIELIAPDDNIQISGGTIEFKWKWHQNKGCLPPPDGYARP